MKTIKSVLTEGIMADNDAIVAKTIKPDLENALTLLQQTGMVIKSGMSPFNSSGLLEAFNKAIKKGLQRGTFNASAAKAELNKYFK